MCQVRLFRLPLFLFMLLVWARHPAPAQTVIPAELSASSKACLECHAASSRGIYQEWGDSKHYRANVGCYECHQAQKGDRDAFEHDAFLISIIVSPKDCARCHAQEVAQFEESHHAKAGLILGSLDNFLADIVEGDRAFYGESALTVSGCKQCHDASPSWLPSSSRLSPPRGSTGIHTADRAASCAAWLRTTYSRLGVSPNSFFWVFTPFTI